MCFTMLLQCLLLFGCVFKQVYCSTINILAIRPYVILKYFSRGLCVGVKKSWDLFHLLKLKYWKPLESHSTEKIWKFWIYKLLESKRQTLWLSCEYTWNFNVSVNQDTKQCFTLPVLQGANKLQIQLACNFVYMISKLSADNEISLIPKQSNCLWWL